MVYLLVELGHAAIRGFQAGIRRLRQNLRGVEELVVHDVHLL